jgi:hypothetical protein
MFLLVKEQGTTISELARRRGISRQLGSRLAGEADRYDGSSSVISSVGFHEILTR